MRGPGPGARGHERPTARPPRAAPSRHGDWAASDEAINHSNLVRQPCATRKTQAAWHNRQQECSLPYGRQREPSVIRRPPGAGRAGGGRVPEIPVGNATRLSCATLPGELESESVLMLDLNARLRMGIDTGRRFPDRGADDAASSRRAARSRSVAAETGRPRTPSGHLSAAPGNISDHAPLQDANSICCTIK